MLEWKQATLIKKDLLSPEVLALTFKVPDWKKHMPGQYYEIRVSLPNGKETERMYSIASSPEDVGIVQFGVEHIKGGEVSPHLWKLPLGGNVLVRGPAGDKFLWHRDIAGPLLLIAGGSGLVPMISMLRHYKEGRNDERDIVLLHSISRLSSALYKKELDWLSRE